MATTADGDHESSRAPTTTATNIADAKDNLIVFFNYRSLFESDCLDTANCESWKEVLEAFGYSKFTRIGFLRELSLATPAEVMQSLCPYTTKSEWGPVLNKRHVRLEREIKALCQVEMLPLQGLKDFLITCAKGCQQLTTVFLSPFSETCTRVLLEETELLGFVDVVHCYTEREFAMLEALEMLNVPPPILPGHLNHRWLRPGDETPAPETAKTRMVAFEADPQGVAVALEFGVAPIGVSFNCFEEHLHSGAGGLSPKRGSPKAKTTTGGQEEGVTTNTTTVKKDPSAPRASGALVDSSEDEDERSVSSNEEGEDDEQDNKENAAAAAAAAACPAGGLSPAQKLALPRRRPSQVTGQHAKAEEGMTGHLKDAEDGGSSVGTKGDATLLDSGVVTVVRDFTSLKYEYLPHMLPAPTVAWRKR